MRRAQVYQHSGIARVYVPRSAPMKTRIAANAANGKHAATDRTCHTHCLRCVVIAQWRLPITSGGQRHISRAAIGTTTQCVNA